MDLSGIWNLAAGRLLLLLRAYTPLPTRLLLDDNAENDDTDEDDEERERERECRRRRRRWTFEQRGRSFRSWYSYPISETDPRSKFQMAVATLSPFPSFSLLFPPFPDGTYELVEDATCQTGYRETTRAAGRSANKLNAASTCKLGGAPSWDKLHIIQRCPPLPLGPPSRSRGHSPNGAGSSTPADRSRMTRPRGGR